MSKKSLISVIIPTHNRANLLKKAIKSVLVQTFQNFEMIVADDSSTDDTKKVVKGFKDKRIKYFLKKRFPNTPAATRNDGIKKAKGKYIAFLDDDDEWLPKKLEIQLRYFKENPKVGLIHTKYYDVYNGKKIEKKDIGCSTVMIKKECIDKYGFFDEKLICAEDRDLWMRIMKKYEKIFINEVLVVHKIHKKQVSSNIKAKIKSEEYFIEKYYKELEEKNILWVYFYRLGSLYFSNKELNKSKSYFSKTIKLRPISLKPYIYYILAELLYLKKKIL